MGALKMVLLILGTLLFPPIGVLVVAGCGMDIFINICLTVLGYIPGHIHAFYLIYVFYQRKGEARRGEFRPRPAPGIYSERVLRGGKHVQVPPPPPVQPFPQPGQVPPGVVVIKTGDGTSEVDIREAAEEA